jgi:enoyl-CoA hydratase
MAVHYESIGNAAVVTISRPHVRNAIDRATAEDLATAWHRFAQDDDAKVGILTGAGGTFCAGADLKAMDLWDDPQGFLGFTRLQVGKPTIAAVAGHCVAGGLELALWCDLRVGGEDAVFGCFERRWGVPLVDGGTQRLPRIVGLSRALDMILTGRAVDALEAHRIGLIDRLVPADAELAEALDLAEVIAGFPQGAVRSDRAAVYAGIGASLSDGLGAERRMGRSAIAEAAEGAGRFASGEGRGGSGV